MFLDGIGSKPFALEAGETTSNTPMTEVISKMSATYTADDQVLICHSQGGLRALAYAASLKSTDADRVKAIVTIGSPIKGEQALMYGGPNLHRRLNRRLANIGRTTNAILDPLFVAPDVGKQILAALNMDQATINALETIAGADDFLEAVFGITAEMSPQNAGTIKFIKEAAYDPMIGFDEDALEALTPNSKFQKDYIFPGTENYWVSGYWTSKLLGYVNTPKIVGWNWIWPIISWVKTPVYSYYYVLPKLNTRSVPRLTSNQKIGHITGGGSGTAGSDILQMVEDVTGGKTKKADVKAILNLAGLGAGAGGIAYAAIAKAVAATGPLGLIASIPLGVTSAECISTGIFLCTFQDSFSNEIYLTRAHDGFVNISGMIYPDGNGNQWLINNSKSQSIKNFPELNHLTERTSPKVWGDGGGFDIGNSTGKIGNTGALYELIKTTTSLRTGSNGY